MSKAGRSLALKIRTAENRDTALPYLIAVFASKRAIGVHGQLLARFECILRPASDALDVPEWRAADLHL